MQASDVVRAVDAAKEVASALQMAVAEATVLQNSNKLALRLLPCDVFARVAFAGVEVFEPELEIRRRLAEVGSPVASLEPRVEPRVYERHGFVAVGWTDGSANEERAPDVRYVWGDHWEGVGRHDPPKTG